MAGSAYIVFHVHPTDTQAQTGQRASVTEQARTWAPQAGWEEHLRQRSVTLDDDGETLTLREHIETAASPRGDRFELPVDGTLHVAGEPGVRATFPTTPIFEAPPAVVYLGVPWETDQGAVVGAIDTFHRMGVTEQDGLELVRYHAREASQFFVHDGTIWYRETNRTALVEPVTGLVVDYHAQETLWTEPHHTGFLTAPLLQQLESKEKVWEAIVEPTPAGEQALLEQAKARRAEHLEDLFTKALPVLGLGEVLLWAAIARRPHRAFPGS